MAHSKHFARLFRRLLAGIAIVVSLQGGNAWARDRAILVAPFQGSKPQGLRELAVKLLEADGFAVAEGPGDLTVKAGDYTVSRAAQDGRAVAVLFVTTALTKVYWRSTLVVRDGASGKVVGETTIQAKSYNGLQKVYKEKLVTELMPLFERCGEEDEPAPAAVAASSTRRDERARQESKSRREKRAARQERQWEDPEPTREPEQDDWSSASDDEEEAESRETESISSPSDHDRRRAGANKTEALRLTLGPNLVMRSWAINDPLTNANDGALLPAHDVPAVGFRTGLLLFPTAFFTDDISKHVGLQVRYAMSLIGETNVENVTRDPNDKVRKTTFQAFDAGLHIRIPVEPFTFGIIGAYGFDALAVEGAKDRVAVPDMRAEFIRAGLLTQVAFGKSTSGSLEFGYRHLLGLGTEAPQIQSTRWFPNALGAGFDARLELRHMFSATFGVTLGGEWNQYAVDFNVQPNHVSKAADAGLPAPSIAGGATDRYLRFDLGAVVSLGK